MSKTTVVKIEDAAVLPTLVARLQGLSVRYQEACDDGVRGKSAYLLARMEMTSRRIKAIVDEKPCCHPYKTARHTADCTTVTHAPMPFADPDSGLTACGIVGPIDDTAPSCDNCTGRTLKEGWTTYPGVFQQMTAREYDLVLEEARGWLDDCGLGDPGEAWKVWNRVNAQYAGGVAEFVAHTKPLWAA